MTDYIKKVLSAFLLMIALLVSICTWNVTTYAQETPDLSSVETIVSETIESEGVETSENNPIEIESEEDKPLLQSEESTENIEQDESETLEKRIESEVGSNGFSELSEEEYQNLLNSNTVFASVVRNAGGVLQVGQSLGRVHYNHGGVSWWDDMHILKINDKYVFCIEPLTTWTGGAYYTANEFGTDGYYIQNAANTSDGRFLGSYPFSITPETQREIERIAKYSFHDNVSNLDLANKYKFTNFLIWEKIGVKGLPSPAGYAEHKALVLDKVINHHSVPSFNFVAGLDGYRQTEHSLRVGESRTFTDQWGVLDKLNVPSAVNGFNVAVNGNDLIVTATPQSIAGELRFAPKSEALSNGTSLVYVSPGRQAVGHFEISDPYFGMLKLNVLPSLGSIELNKLTSEGGILPGAEFELLKDNAVVATQTTGQDGKLSFNDLSEGAYSIREKNNPYGYVLNTEVKAVNVIAGQKSVVEFVNQVQKGLIEIAKVSRKHGTVMINESYSLAGAEFGVYRGTEQIGTIITNAEGKGHLGDLVLGTYTLRELKAPKGFTKTDEVFEVTLTADNKISTLFSKLVTVANDEILGRIKVIKLDKETESTLPNALYGIYDANGKEVERLITDKNGSAISSLLPIATYSVKEINAPYGYILNAVAQGTTLVDNSTKELTFKNVPQKGALLISKVSRSNGTQLLNENYSLSGAEFGVFRGTEQVGTIVTDAKGNGNLTNLPLGDYTIKELKAPKGFLLSNAVQKVSLTSNNQTASVFTESLTVANDEVYGRIKIVKKDHEIDAKLKGAKFNILDASGNIVDILVTDQNGTAISKLLPLGTYKAVEVEAPNQYVLDTTPYEFVLIYKDQLTELIEVTKTILNTEENPKIGTTLTGLEGEKAVDPLQETILKDIVNITGAVVGKWYDILGHLRVVETGEKLMYQGKEVTATTRVLAKEPNFTVELFFTFDARDLRGNNVVAFEDAYTNGRHVATEAKIDNPPQTVRIRNPRFKTKANINGEKTVTAGGKYTVMDLIMYEDFSPMKWYEFVGTIANPVTKQDLLINGKVPTGVVYVRPETENGEAVVEIELEDTFGLDGTFVVLETSSRVFVDKENPTPEELKNAKKEVIAEHKDYDDKEQQFTIVPPKPQLPATGEVDNVILIATATLLMVLGLLVLFKQEDV